MSLIRRPRLRLALFLLLVLAAPLALGWAGLGHRLVGELAQRQLSPQTLAEVQQLLAGEPDPTLAGVATWADDLRNADPPRFKATSKWHYINAKGGGCEFEMARDCPNGDCVVGAIEQQRAILADRDRPLTERRDALKFIVHFIGDAHQPMHAGNRTDAGGNGYQISLRTDLEPEAYAKDKYVGGVMGTNLHAVWDYYVLGEERLPLRQYADRLDALPWPSRDAATAIEPLTWAKESCRLIDARGLYPNTHKMDRSYPDAMRPLAEQRVRQAAYRLAALLNQTLGKGASARDHSAHAHASTPSAPSPLVIPLDTATLASLPRQAVSATAHGQPLQCEGVSLPTLLRKAGALPDDKLPGPLLSRYVLVQARDGYRVLYSLAELDPGTGRREAVLVDRCAGRPLDRNDGPLRLIAPQEARPARWIRQIESITVVSAP